MSETEEYVTKLIEAADKAPDENKIEILELAVKFNASSFATHNAYGLALLDQNHAWDARRSFQEALRIEPDNVDALINYGRAVINEEEMTHRSNYSGAISALSDAVKLAPQNATAHLYLGLAYKNNGDERQAINYYKKSASLDPSSGDVYWHLGTLYFEIEDWEDSVKALERCAEIYSEDDEVYHHLAKSYMKLENYTAASKACEKAISLNPENSDDSFGLLGDIVKQTESWESLILFCEDFIENREEKNENEGPDNSCALYCIGLARIQLGQNHQAVEALEEALNMFPEFDYIYPLLLDLQTPEQAVKYFEEFIEGDGYLYPEATIILANAHFELRNFTRVCECLESIEYSDLLMLEPLQGIADKLPERLLGVGIVYEAYLIERDRIAGENLDRNDFD